MTSLTPATLKQRLSRTAPEVLADRLMRGQVGVAWVEWNSAPVPLVEILITQATLRDLVPLAPTLALLEAVLARGGHRNEADQPDPTLWASFAEKSVRGLIKDPADYAQRAASWNRVLALWAAHGGELEARDADDATLLHQAVVRKNLNLATALVHAGVNLATASPGRTSVLPFLEDIARGRTEWQELCQHAQDRQRAQGRLQALQVQPATVRARPRYRS